MKSFYVTFGQVHTHSINGKTIDKDCVVEMTAKDMDSAIEECNGIFKKIYFGVYENIPDMSYFPRGIIKI